MICFVFRWNASSSVDSSESANAPLDCFELLFVFVIVLLLLQVTDIHIIYYIIHFTSWTQHLIVTDAENMSYVF